MVSVVDQPPPDSVCALALEADDCLLPSLVLRWWRDKPVYKRAHADALSIVRASERSHLIKELDSIGSYLTWKLRHNRIDTDEERDDYLAEMLLELWLGRVRYRAADEIAGKLSDRAFAAAPHLPTKRTKDGLYKLDDDLLLHDHYAVLDKVAIPPSMFLRRHFGGTPSFDFLRRLALLAQHPGRSVAVGLDTAHSAPVADVVTVFEEDYWYGPPFSLAGIDDPGQVGVTRHWTRPPVQPLHYPVAVTEFRWQLNSETQKALEIEETYFPLEPEWDPQAGHPWFINRYVHSLRDMDKGSFVHLDGAVKLFAKEGYDPYERRPKRSGLHYKKLFRVDGAIPNDDWMQLVAHYLRGNDHVHEYFGETSLPESGETDQQREPRP
ncbi:MAG: hypothetical protein M3285_02790 [Actinomycetota bacterium]|nr:hypothetical protein [Actinomycetota bacterium]MDQ3954458.1 hypothetical protein [Actinomycetota bacterium]